MKPIVAIRIPTLLNVNAPLCSYLTAIAGMDMSRAGFEFRIDYIIGKSPHDYARNVAVQDVFTDERIDRVWFMDADVIPDANCMRLLRHECDIVTGMYANGKRKDDGTIEPVSQVYKKSGDDWNCVDTDDMGIAEVDGAGMGMMVIHRRVLTDPRMVCGEIKGGQPIPVFRHTYGPDGRVLMSEDIDFCNRAKQNGYRIIADTSVRCGHIKEVNIKNWQESLWALKKQFA